VQTVCIAFPIGCPRSILNAAHLINYFKINGINVTSDFRKADTLMVSTCGFNQEFEDYSIKNLEVASRQKKKNSKLYAIGCLTGINPERLLKYFDIIPLKNTDLIKLDSIIDSKIKIFDMNIGYDLDKYRNLIFKPKEEFELLALRDNKIIYYKILLRSRLKKIVKYFGGSKVKSFLYKNIYSNKILTKKVDMNTKIMDVRISYGCESYCTYCAIRLFSGHLTSIPPEKVLDTINIGLKDGYKTFSLVGEDAGAYGLDIGSNITNLLKSILSIDEEIKIRFNDFSPKWLIMYFQEFHKIFIKHHGNIDRFMLPIQSGSEKILKSMKRDHTAKDLRECLRALKRSVPNLQIESHVLVGFPGETEQDFLDTLELLQYLKFSEVQIYPYSDRPNTESFKMMPKVSEDVIGDRISRILNLNINTKFILENFEQYRSFHV